MPNRQERQRCSIPRANRLHLRLELPQIRVGYREGRGQSPAKECGGLQPVSPCSVEHDLRMALDRACGRELAQRVPHVCRNTAFESRKLELTEGGKGIALVILGRPVASVPDAQFRSRQRTRRASVRRGRLVRGAPRADSARLGTKRMPGYRRHAECLA